MNILYLKACRKCRPPHPQCKTYAGLLYSKFRAVSFSGASLCRNLLIYQRFCCHSISFCSIHARRYGISLQYTCGQKQDVINELADTSFHIFGGATALLIPTNAKALLCLQKRLLCIRK